MNAPATLSKRILLLIGFVVVVLFVGMQIGIANAPDAWYQALVKPSFNPPNWVFGPVWSVLYVCIAVAGWRTFLSGPRSVEMRLWVLQMVLNWIWSPVWFTLHAPWSAFVIISLIWLVILAFTFRSWRADRISAMLFLPYLAWVSFASVLNFSIAYLN